MHYLSVIAGCMLGDCCSPPLLVPGCFHVDADGGCGLVRGTGASVYQETEVLHHWLHCRQLW